MTERAKPPVGVTILGVAHILEGSVQHAGNQVKVIAAGKSIKASWIKMG